MQRGLVARRTRQFAAKIRGSKRRSPVIDALPAKDIDIQSLLIHEQLRERLDHFMESLSPGNREAFFARYYLELDQKEAARYCNISIEALKKRLGYVRHHLKIFLASEGISSLQQIL